MTDFLYQKSKKSGSKFIFACFLFSMVINLPIWGHEADFFRAHFAAPTGYHGVERHLNDNTDEVFPIQGM